MEWTDQSCWNGCQRIDWTTENQELKAYRYIFYAIILIAYLIFQTGLKEKPQIWLLTVAGAMILLYHLKRNIIFRFFNLVLITVLMWSFVFQIFYFLWDWINPNRGQIMVDGRMERVMDMSGLFVGGLSFAIALIFALVNWNINKKKSIQPEYHLAIATFLLSGGIFAYFELL